MASRKLSDSLVSLSINLPSRVGSAWTEEVDNILRKNGLAVLSGAIFLLVLQTWWVSFTKLCKPPPKRKNILASFLLAHYLS